MTLLCGGHALAQESGSNITRVDGAQVAVIERPRIRYIDAPISLQQINDAPVMDEPVLLAPEDDPAFLKRMEDIRQYSEAIQDIELDGGVWDGEMVDELIAIGNLQQQQGNHTEAIETFDRAIHVTRINSGLHTLNQIPAVERRIESHIALRDWEQADLYYNYLYYVQSKAYGPEDPRIIPVLDSLASWNIRAFNVGYGEALGVRLSTASLLFSAAARMVRVHFGIKDDRFIGYMSDIATSAYLVARHPELMIAVRQPDLRSGQELLRHQLGETSSINPAGYASGERALMQIINHYASQPGTEVELAEALANLGDWYLMFGQRRGAITKYGEVWQLLSAMEDGEAQLQVLFGQVAHLPTFVNHAVSVGRAYSSDSEVGETLISDYADVMFDVTENGIVRNIRIMTEETPENRRQLSRLRREVRNSYFRPIIVDGIPTRTDEHQFRYQYWY